jgi:hypothetical protein
MDHRDKILDIVKSFGPSLPSQINKELRTNVLFASAMLAEMVDQKKLRLTSMKVGGSPLYYCDGQENLLENFAKKLDEREYSAFERLKKSKVLRDRDQEPLTRVALREIKDFAVALEVTANGYSDLFWKYYLVSDEEAKSLIKDYINKNVEQERVPAAVPEEVQSTIPDIAEPDAAEDVKKPMTSVTMTKLDGSKVPEFSYQPEVSFSTVIDTEEKVKLQKRPVQQQLTVPEPVVFPEDDDFFRHVKSFFDKSDIEIQHFSLIRRGSEYDFIISLPSNVGSLNYYCKAKSKSKINEGDLSTAFVYGQMKKLPILFVTVGDLTKRAQELLSGEFKSMFVKKI